MRLPLVSVACALHDASQIGEARRLARRLAVEAGLAEPDAERAALVVSEAARNALVHGGGGEVVLRAVGGGAVGPALEILALDRGPGIADVEAAMRDGYSTAGTAGHGLGAIARQAQAFEVHTRPGGGVALYARVGAAEGPAGVVCLPMRGERACGDGWAVRREGRRSLFLVVDGLGHGAAAADASAAAVAALERAPDSSVVDVLERIHGALRATRGAAVSVLEVIAGAPVARYGGIGNVSGSIWSAGGVRRMVSLPGTAGHVVRRIQAFDYEWPDDGLLVLHSDGLAGHFDLSPASGLARRHPALVAGVLYRDHARGRDDVTVLVARRPA